MLGFGIKELSSITSPILEIKNKITNKKIETLLIQHLTGTPHDIDEEEIMGDVFDDAGDELKQERKPDIQFLEEFIIDEKKMGNVLSDADLFDEWVINHPSRAFSLDIQIGDFRSLSPDFVVRIKSEELNVEVTKDNLAICSELNTEINCTASFSEFIDFVVSNVSKTIRVYRESYQKLYIQKSLARLGFPKEPDVFYQRTWSQIRSIIVEKSRGKGSIPLKKIGDKGTVEKKPKAISTVVMTAHKEKKDQTESVDKRDLVNIFSKVHLANSVSKEFSAPSERDRLFDINNESLENFELHMSEEEVIIFLNQEYLLGNNISDYSSYLDWRNGNPHNALLMPIRLAEHVNLSWRELAAKAKRVAQ
tara:strand:+ start:69 stop:1160 length:1092 start_codon:yes stop_codon:yes gene_type:complete